MLKLSILFQIFHEFGSRLDARLDAALFHFIFSNLEIIKTDFFAGKKVEISKSVVDFVLLSILFEAEHNTAFL